MCDSVISEDPFSIVFFPDKYKTQIMCDEAVDDCLAALKFIPDWIVTNKMLQKLDNALHANDEDFDKVTFIANHRHGFSCKKYM